MQHLMKSLVDKKYIYYYRKYNIRLNGKAKCKNNVNRHLIPRLITIC